MPHSKSALKLAAALLSGGSRYAREANITYDTARLLSSLNGIENADIEREHPTGGGRVDIFLPRFRTVVEVKKSGGNRLAHQELPSRLADAQSQMEGYVEAEINSEKSRLNLEGRPIADKRWTGILSDGRYWRCWTYRGGTLKLGDGRRPAFVLGPESKPEQLLDALSGVLDPDPDLKTWIPSDPSEVFKGHPEALKHQYESMPDEIRPGARTKLALWHDMLRASGLSPQGRAGDESQFAMHSFLIAVARMVAHLLSPTGADWKHSLQDGFASWVLEWTGGMEWAEDLWDTIQRYDWRSRRGEVLRILYESFVAESDRNVFGEFYTPDWLAGMMVDRVLDEDWLDQAVPAAEVALQTGEPLKGVGILDPACGSGTFLYHSALRIVQAETMLGLLPQQRADVASLLLNGIDVHPVAVEVAKATLLRALPAEPRAGAGAIRIYLGDSLLTDEDHFSLFGHRKNAMRLETPQGREFFLPLELVRQDGFPDAMRRLVLAAVNRKPVPAALLQSVGETARRRIEECRDALEGTVQSEGNSVWTVYAVNRAAPHLLAERKVDRIVANPPWVELASIQEAARKRDMEELGRSLGLQVGGKQAANLDIASFFVLRARELYLNTPKSDPGIWLVKRSALKSGHWKLFRGLHERHLRQTVDLLELQPFGGGDARRCCLLAEHTAFRATVSEQGSPPRLTAKLRPSERRRPGPNEDWPNVHLRIELVPPRPPPPQAPAGYALSEFRRGASVIPHVLLRVAGVERLGRGRALVWTQRSSKKPWNKIPSQRVEIPRRWVSRLYTSKDVFAFVVAVVETRAIIPTDALGETVLDTAMYEPGWEALDDLWRAHKARGKSTPRTLAARLDYGQALLLQPRTGGPESRMVLYPKSGDIMRAARIVPASGLVDDGLYWHLAGSEREAGYLTALLNAPCLELAFRESRESGRDFQLHPWRKVPIPRFDPKDDRHKRLADVCSEAESAAGRIRDRFPNSGQVKVSKEIRAELVRCGIAARINALAAQLLPDQAES